MTTLKNERADSVAVSQVLAGNREAYDDLLHRYSPSVLRLCGRLLGDLVEGQDVAQEAVLQAYLGLGRLQQPGRFGAWLHAIAANLAHSALRRRRARPLESLDMAPQPGVQRPRVEPTTEQVVAMRQMHEATIGALMEFTEVNREAMVGYYLQDYSYSELASALGVPVSTVKSRLSKAGGNCANALTISAPRDPLTRRPICPR